MKEVKLIAVLLALILLASGCSNSGAITGVNLVSGIEDCCGADFSECGYLDGC